jgi:hypothetical protein
MRLQPLVPILGRVADFAGSALIVFGTSTALISTRHNYPLYCLIVAAGSAFILPGLFGISKCTCHRPKNPTTPNSPPHPPAYGCRVINNQVFDEFPPQVQITSP